mgnify:CR=1 FL=1
MVRFWVRFGFDLGVFWAERGRKYFFCASEMGLGGLKRGFRGQEAGKRGDFWVFFDPKLRIYEREENGSCEKFMKISENFMIKIFFGHFLSIFSGKFLQMAMYK